VRERNCGRFRNAFLYQNGAGYGVMTVAWNVITNYAANFVITFG
jgi:hypothetical protein